MEGRCHSFDTKRGLEFLEKLEGTEELRLNECDGYRFKLNETISSLPKLKYLIVKNTMGGTLRFSDLGRPFITKHHLNLERLYLFHYAMWNEDDLAHFLFDMLPFLPNLSSFKIGANRIKSLQTIARRIHNNETPENSRTNRLRRLNLGLPIDSAMHVMVPRYPEETDALKTVLRAFPELHSVIIPGYFEPEFDPDDSIDALLEINNARHILTESRGSQSGPASGNSNTLPLSLWPMLLERAWNLSGHYGTRMYRRMGPDGIYHLLRSVPELREARAVQRNQPV